MIIHREFARKIAPIMNAFASQRSHLPASCFIKADVGGDTARFILRNDTGAIFTAEIPTVEPVSEAMSVAVTATSLASWFNHVDEDVKMYLSENKTSLWIVDGLSRKKLGLIVTADYDIYSGGIKVCDVPVDDFDAILAETTYAITPDVTANIITQGLHMNFRTAGGTLMFQSTDGLRAAIVEIDGISVLDDYSVLVPESAMRVLRATVKSLGSLDAADNPSPISVYHVPTASGKSVVRFRQAVYGVTVSFDIIPFNIEQALRDMRNLYRLDGCVQTKVTVDKKSLAQHLRKIQSDGLTTLYNHVMVRIDDGVLYFSAATVMDKVRNAAEVGMSEFAVEGDASLFKFRLSLPFVNAAIRALPGSSVSIIHFEPPEGGWRPIYFSSDLALGEHFVLPIIND